MEKEKKVTKVPNSYISDFGQEYIFSSTKDYKGTEKEKFVKALELVKTEFNSSEDKLITNEFLNYPSNPVFSQDVNGEKYWFKFVSGNDIAEISAVHIRKALNIITGNGEYPMLQREINGQKFATKFMTSEKLSYKEKYQVDNSLGTFNIKGQRETKPNEDYIKFKDGEILSRKVIVTKDVGGKNEWSKYSYLYEKEVRQKLHALNIYDFNTRNYIRKSANGVITFHSFDLLYLSSKEYAASKGYSEVYDAGVDSSDGDILYNLVSIIETEDEQKRYQKAVDYLKEKIDKKFTIKMLKRIW